IRDHLFIFPLEKLAKNNNFLEIDKTNKRIKFNNNFEDDYQLSNQIIQLSFESLKNSNEYYKNLELDQLLNYDSYQEQKLMNNYHKKFSKVEIRQYQYWFSKMVKDRDTKCVICCEDYPGLLEAAHIKPYAKCDLQSMFDSLNGITLCKNHHSLFDEGYFTFNNDWTIKLSKADKFKLYKEDLDLKFKQYESCFDKLKVTKHNITVYDTIHN
ncbi:MAG: HNH endonuclease, partial [Ureaplasma sp.]|nr:HNH endonuclease [Ureaplasma sp.]